MWAKTCKKVIKYSQVAHKNIHGLAYAMGKLLMCPDNKGVV